MTNRREEEFAYSGPSRSGVFWAAGLVLLALIIGVVVLQKVDSKKSNGASNIVTPTETTVATTDSSTPAVIGDPNVPTTLAATAARLPAAVRVIVTNGSGVNKAARRVNEALVPSGYQMVSPRDANAKNLADAVFYKPGFEAEANAIAASLGNPAIAIFVGGLPATPTIKTPPAAPDFDVQVMVGPLLAQKFKPGATPAADPAATPAAAEVTTSTTAAP
jgi:LytR cell envelope-related transcriptional attenuator